LTPGCDNIQLFFNFYGNYLHEPSHMNEKMVIDEKFVAKLKKGDEYSFKLLYEQFAPTMRLVCKRYVKNEMDAEDVFHEGFLKVYNGVGKLKNASSFVGWMKRIFINLSIDYYNRTKKIPVNIEDINESNISQSDDSWEGLDEGDSPVNDYDAIRKVNFSQEEMLDVLMLVPEHFRIVFQLYVIDGYKHQEIAEMLSINEKTSKTRLLRARGLLKKELHKLALGKMQHERFGQLY
jgi:RNA polymerase sigma-70 factor, ECF subfamily